MKRFSNILFVADSSSDNGAALERAITLANNNQARLTVIGTVEPSRSRNSSSLRNALIAEQDDRLAALVQELQTRHSGIETKVLVGTPFVEIIREVIRNQRDLVVKSVEHGGSRLFGGTDIKLLRKCPCPLWMINSRQSHDYRNILVALDYEPENPENQLLNKQLLEMASSLAMSEFAQLHVVSAWQLEHENAYRSPRLGLSASDVDQMLEAEKQLRQRWLTELLEGVDAVLSAETRAYLKTEMHVLKGSAAQMVPDCARDIGAELIVMGTVGRTGIPGFIIGNTAEEILGKIECSVLAVKPAGFITPVADLPNT